MDVFVNRETKTLYVFGKGTRLIYQWLKYEFKTRTWDPATKTWVVQLGDDDDVDEMQKKIMQEYQMERDDDREERSERAKEAWRKRRAMKQCEMNYRNQLPEIEKLTEGLRFISYYDDYNIYEAVGGLAEEVKKYVDNFEHRYDYVGYCTKIDWVSPNHCLLRRNQKVNYS